MHMFDLFSLELYTDMINKKYVRANKHNELPLYILNYTEHAQYDNEWNEVTRQCRGLIVDAHGNVIARPYDKFLNYGQPGADPIGLDDQVDVTDKLDGSMGILWEYKGHVGIATRGSFHSEQAEHATKLWHEKYAAEFGLPPTYYTMMFEIIYPSNRVVLDYGDLDDIVLIGARDISRGSSIPAVGVTAWRWKKVRTFHYHTLQEALEAAPRPNAEGYVVHASWNDYRIKIKQEDYIQLHKLVTGLTKRRVWEYLRSGGNPRELALTIPDEWHPWLTETCDELYTVWQTAWQEIHGEFYRVTRIVGDNASRKEFALEALKHKNYDLLFQLLDGKDVYAHVWDLVKPPADA